MKVDLSLFFVLLVVPVVAHADMVGTACQDRQLGHLLHGVGKGHGSGRLEESAIDRAESHAVGRARTDACWSFSIGGIVGCKSIRDQMRRNGQLPAPCPEECIDNGLYEGCEMHSVPRLETRSETYSAAGTFRYRADSEAYVLAFCHISRNCEPRP